MSPSPPSRWSLGAHFCVEQARLLGYRELGPLLAASSLHSSEQAALRVYDPSYAFENGALPRCSTLQEAREEVRARFEQVVASLQAIHSHEEGSPPISPNLPTPCLPSLPLSPPLPPSHPLSSLPLASWRLLSPAVARLLSFSCDAQGCPSPAVDGCFYHASELAFFSLDQLITDSRNLAHSPSEGEVRETLRSLLAMLACIHAAGCALRSHQPSSIMRFAKGWKLTSPSLLLPTGHPRPSPHPPGLYTPPEMTELIARGERWGARLPHRRLALGPSLPTQCSPHSFTPHLTPLTPLIALSHSPHLSPDPPYSPRDQPLTSLPTSSAVTPLLSLQSPPLRRHTPSLNTLPSSSPLHLPLTLLLASHSLPPCSKGDGGS